MSVFSLFFGSNKNPVFSDDSGNTSAAFHTESPAGTTLSQWDYTGYARIAALGKYSNEAASVSIDTGGTVATNGTSVIKLHASSAANKTGLIMFQPTTNVFLFLINTDAAHTLTFAAAGTSFVYDGANVVVTHGAVLYYSVADSLWYALGFA